MDPTFITSENWGDLGFYLGRLWLFFGAIILLAFSLVSALGVIPSLVASGYLPSKPPGPLKLVRPLLFLTAATAAVVALLLMAQMIPGVISIVATIYERWAL